MAEDKSDLRILLENKVDILIGNVCTYALTVNNNTLYNKFYFSLSDIEHMGGSDIINFTTTLLAEIALNTANYVGVGMDTIDVTDATTDLTNFSAALVSPRVAGTTQSANNDAHNQVQLLTPICIVLDNFMRPYRQKNKKFYDAYHSSRRLVSAATFATKANVLVVNSITKAPIPDAEVASADSAFTGKTNAEGIINFDPITYGVIDFGATATGFKPGSTNGTNLKMGQNTSLTISLDPL